MLGEAPVCSYCGYPIHTNEHSPDCPTRKETEKILEGENFKNVVDELRRTLETKDIDQLKDKLRSAESDWLSLEKRDGRETVGESLEWYDQHNHRINLYKIGGHRSEEWDEEESTPGRNEHLLSLKQLDIVLKQFARSENPTEASRVLHDVLNEGRLSEHSLETSIDTLARLGKDGGSVLEAYSTNKAMPLHRRLRGMLSLFRYGEPSAIFTEQVQDILAEVSGTTNPNLLNSALELAVIMGVSSGLRIMRIVEQQMQKLSSDQRQWLERDLLSAQLALNPDGIQVVKKRLSGRAWVSHDGIVFGSLASMDVETFNVFVEKNLAKLEQLAEALKRTNEAFGSEPILYVDLIPDNMSEVANEGWTQNSIHLSQTLMEHPRVSIQSTVQGAIHEACERWESKGFVDAGMEEDYLRLLGNNYATSELDKFRLRHRIDIPSHAGHPWDGTREYMAEAGSILLAEPDKEKELFGSQTNGPASRALNYTRKLIAQHADRKK
jgi:hypothetical protein